MPYPRGRRGRGGVVAPTGNYVRPSDWPPLPSVSEGEQVWYGLYAVWEHGPNPATIVLSGGNYTVNWGDGSATESVNGGVAAVHNYDYSSLPDSNLSTRGYKTVIIEARAAAGQTITGIDLRFRPSGFTNLYSSSWLDVRFSMPNCTGFLTRGNTTPRLIEQIEQVGTWNVSSLNSSFRDMGNLKNVINLDVAGTSGLTSAFSGARSLMFIPDGMDLSNVIDFSGSFQDTPVSGNIDIALPVATNISTAFLRNAAVYSIRIESSSSLANASSFVNSCTNLRSLEITNCSGITSAGTMLNVNPNLSRLILTGMTRGVNIANANMDRVALVAFFNSLGTASGAQTINITGNPGTSSLTNADRQIATDKGFTLVG